LPPRPGRLDGRNRIDLVATLRSAAPWQTLRRAAATNAKQPICIRPSDIRVKCYEDRRDRLVIFAVDASGSAAMARLGEAKGAVEVLLAEAYAQRDHVALIGFRGVDAEVLLPPTRSLVQTKRRLSALPGGGGTPLAAGLMAAADLAAQSSSAGLSPVIALLTDGRANVGLDGKGGRQQANADAKRMATHLRGGGWPVLALDTANRPQRALQDLARTMGATYLPMPRADATTLGRAVSHALA
jgi:magnesium chelatase subunit D